MTKEELMAVVGAHRPIDGRESRSLHRCLVALGRLSDPFDQSRNLTHVTGSALVVGRQGVLLLRHRRLGIWVQPGGHLDEGETPWVAARREAEEETGISMAPYDAEPPRLAHVDVHDGGRGHVHLDLRYLVRPAGDDTPRPPEGESQDVEWFGWEAAVAMADPGLRGWLLAQMGADWTG